MRVKDIGKIKDLDDLRELNSNDVIELLDELRAIAMKRGTELLGQGRKEARRAIGAPDEGAVTWALIIGIALGAVAAAIATMLMSPMTGSEARRRLTEQVEKVRESTPIRPDGNGRSIYERERMPASGEVGTTAPTA